MQGKKCRAEGTYDRPRYKWNVNVNVDFQELAFGGVNWFKLCQDRIRGRVQKFPA